jgi:hypothetical protein
VHADIEKQNHSDIVIFIDRGSVLFLEITIHACQPVLPLRATAMGRAAIELTSRPAAERLACLSNERCFRFSEM